jgi:MoxR-like ATPase
MNEDESTYEIPDYILSRLQPTLSLGFPNRDDEMAILRYHLPFAADDLLGLTVQFLARSHELRLDFSPRDGIHVLQYALKRLAQNPNHPLGKDGVWREALWKVLGEESLDLDRLAEQRRRMLGNQALPAGLGDFFFDEDDPMHPDRE